MNQSQVVIHGTLRADGTLQLDEKPNLPPGRIRITMTTMTESPTAEDAWSVLQRIWQERDSLGMKGRTGEAIVAEINAMRDEWEEEPDQAKPGC